MLLIYNWIYIMKALFFSVKYEHHFLNKFRL